MENDVFTAVLDPQRGVIRSLIDKRSGRELVDTNSDFGLGQYLYERRGVLVTAFGDISNTGKTQLRLWELAGESGTLTVKLPKGMNVSKMTPVNLRGEPTGKSERIWFGRFSVELKAFAPASFVLE